MTSNDNVIPPLVWPPTINSAFDRQVGGNHYKDMPIQPIEFIVKNGIPFLEGNVIKYVVRWNTKGGLQDLKKARHYIDLLIELEEEKSGTKEVRNHSGSSDPAP